jgi:hypothetical protein
MNTATDFSTARPLDNAAGQAHRAVDRAKEKAAPMLERAATAAHKTIDTVAEKTAPRAMGVGQAAGSSRQSRTQFADVAAIPGAARPIVSVAAAARDRLSDRQACSQRLTPLRKKRAAPREA